MSYRNLYYSAKYKPSEFMSIIKFCNDTVRKWSNEIFIPVKPQLGLSIHYSSYEYLTYRCKLITSHELIELMLLYPPHNEVVGGYTGFTPSVRPSVRPSVCPSVRPSRMPCPLCIIYSYGWIIFILGTNDHYHERVCRAPWPLTLTYIFKVIRPWLRKSCPLCSVYSSGWILSIFGTNDHHH